MQVFTLSHAAAKDFCDPTPPSNDPIAGVEEPVVYLNFQKAIHAYEWMDSHLFLPVYDLDADWPWRPESVPWIQLPWWTPGRAAQQIYVYFDGSASRDREHAGCGVAAFIYDGEWTFTLLAHFQHTFLPVPPLMELKLPDPQSLSSSSMIF